MGDDVEALVRIGMSDRGQWEPATGEAAHPVPGEPCLLAAAPERLAPEQGHLIAEEGHAALLPGTP